MRINIDAGSLFVGAVTIGGLALLYYISKKKDKKAKEERTRLDELKKSLVKDRDINDEVMEYSVRNRRIDSPEDRALVYSILKARKTKMNKARTCHDFEEEFNKFNGTIKQLSNPDKAELEAVICVWRNEDQAVKEKRKEDLLKSENFKDRATDRRNATKIANAIRAIKAIQETQDLINLDLKLN